MQVRLHNIQSFKDVVYDFPDTGLVQIIGDNSNGKSILGKVFTAIAELKFTIQEERDSLIRDGEESGYAIIVYKGKCLSILLHRQRNNCYVKLKRTNGEEVVRTIREGGLEMLVAEFGFRVYGKNAIVLQVHETLGSVLFVNTSPSLNFEAVDAVTTDTVAQQFLTNFKEQTHKKAKQLLQEYNAKAEAAKRLAGTLVMYDHAAYQGIHDKMERAYNVLKHLELLELEEVDVLRPASILGLPQLNMPEVSISPEVKLLCLGELDVPEVALLPKVQFIGQAVEIDDIYEPVRNLYEVMNGRCPVCGRPLLDCAKDRDGQEGVRA